MSKVISPSTSINVPGVSVNTARWDAITAQQTLAHGQRAERRAAQRWLKKVAQRNACATGKKAGKK